MLKQNIAMIFNIEVVDAVQKTEIKKVKLLNRKIEIKNEVTENEIKNEIYVKTKYWHEC